MLDKRSLEQVDKSLSNFDVDSISLFGALTANQLVQLWSYLEVRSYAAGVRVFQQGDLPTDIFILINGRIDFVVEKNGVHKLESSLKGGDVFGETAFIGIQPQVGSAIVSTHEDAELLVLTREALMRIHEEDTELFGMLMMNLARELSRKVHCMIDAA